jgi:Ca-activated chloride channel family protein
MRGSTSRWWWPVCALAWLLPSAATAAQYAAMNELPVGGGELRLKVADVDSGEFAFPLKRTRVELRVTGVMAHISVEQHFTNPFKRPVEAVYVFPLGADAAVTGYQLKIGERTINGVLRERGEARRSYQRARASGRTAGLLEQERPNIFTQSVANIAAGQDVRVRFTLVQRVAYDSGRYELVHPMVVGPRFLPPGTRSNAPASLTHLRPGERPGHDIQLRVTLEPGVPLQRIWSTSHRIITRSPEPSRAEVTLAAGDRIPNKDLVLRYRTAGSRSMVGVLAHRRPGRDGYLALVVQPKARFTVNEVASREVIVLIDRSGSMDGAPLRQAKAIAMGMLSTLGPRDTFNVIDFADSVAMLSRRPLRADADAVDRGKAYVRGLRASGGTMMLAGVARALERAPAHGQVRMIYLITDGYIGNEDDILAAARRLRGDNRIFTLGIGSSPNRYLMSRLAQVGRGFSSFLRHDEDPGPLVRRLVQRSAFPYLTNVTIDWGGLGVHGVTPTRLPDLHVGQPLAVVARYSRPGAATVTIRGSVNGKPLSTRVAVKLPARQQRPVVASLWARERIRELMLIAARHRTERPEIRRQVTALALEASLVTRYTSFVAIDERRVAGRKGSPERLVQAAAAPEGMGMVGPAVLPDGERAVASAPSPASPPSPAPRRSGPMRGPAPVRRAYSPSTSSYRSTGWRGGGDVDPLLIVIAASTLGSLVWRRRRGGRR